MMKILHALIFAGCFASSNLAPSIHRWLCWLKLLSVSTKTTVPEMFSVFFAVLSSGLWRQLHLRNPLLKHHMGSIFQYPSLAETLYGFNLSIPFTCWNTVWVQSFNTLWRKYLGRELSPGRVGEKHERYLCAMLTPLPVPLFYAIEHETVELGL